MLIARTDKAAAAAATSRSHHCTFLTVASFLSLQLFFLLSSRLSPHGPAPPFSATSRQLPAAPPDDAAACPSGRVYVYDLPPEFNRALIDACDELNPWNSRCSALSNHGFGLPSGDLAGLVPDELLPAWFDTDQFAGELIYHRRILGHRCRTDDPAAADAFYVPFYGGFAVGKYLWSSVPNHTYTAEDRDRLCRRLLAWISSQPHWRGGQHHFMMLGRITWDFRRSRDEDWGGSLLYMPGMSNVTRLLIERNPWDELDVGVPYPTGFHPRAPSDIRLWRNHVLGRNRTALFCFAGAARRTIRGDFRGILLSQCAAAGGRCQFLDCSARRCANRTGETLGLFLDSEFCLQPRGDSFTRRSVFDCIVAGSIPVFFWRRTAVGQYDLFLPDEVEEYAVVVDRQAVRNGSLVIREVLEGIGEERRRRMRERVSELIPKLVYAQPERGMGAAAMDAFDIAVEGVLRRFRDQKRRRQ